MSNKVDNFDLIRGMLDFSDDTKFYYLQILQRKKENLQLGSNSRSVKDYRIRSLEQYDELKDEIIGLCEYFNARASIRLNRRNYKNVAFKTLEKIVNQISQDDFTSVKYTYNKCMGANHNEPNKSWILDIDELDYDETELLKTINLAKPEGDKLIGKVPSKNGYHLIVKPFDLRVMYEDDFNHIDIHKDNPTNLYIG